MPLQPALSRVSFVLPLPLLLIACAACAPVHAPAPVSGVTTPPAIVIDARAQARPFPHFWEKMFGSGRSVLSLRESYRRDLRRVRDATGIAYVRFHDIFHDDTGVYEEDERGRARLNFSLVDQIYDGLLDSGVRPFVEIGFMPRALASTPATFPFWYAPHTAPPKRWEAWDALVHAFVAHLVERYGVDEVAQWFFEIWNEPNIDFWAGEPKEASYYELYDHTARAITSVSPRLRIGGPATAQAAWVDRFIRHAVDAGVPLHFVSTHAYGNDDAKAVFGASADVAHEAREEKVCLAARKVHDQVRASARPDLPIVFSEFNASYLNEPLVTDSTYMAPWIANTVRACDGLTTMMAYWTFSDVFDEQGVVKEPFYGGFGLIAEGGIAKPAFHAFALLHRLGEERIPLPGVTNAIATRRRDGSLVIAVWTFDARAEIALRIDHLDSLQHASRAIVGTVSRVDAQHGSALATYEAMGRPRYPTRAQLDALRRASDLPAPETVPIDRGMLRVALPSQGFALLEIAASP